MTGIRLGWKWYGYDRDYDRVFVGVSIGKKTLMTETQMWLNLEIGLNDSIKFCV